MVDFGGDRLVVGNTPTPIFRGIVSDLQSVIIYTVGSIEIGNVNVAVGTGLPLAGSSSFTFSHRDFRPDDKKVQSSNFDIYAVAAAPTTVQVTRIMR